MLRFGWLSLWMRLELHSFLSENGLISTHRRVHACDGIPAWNAIGAICYAENALLIIRHITNLEATRVCLVHYRWNAQVQIRSSIVNIGNHLSLVPIQTRWQTTVWLLNFRLRSNVCFLDWMIRYLFSIDLWQNALLLDAILSLSLFDIPVLKLNLITDKLRLAKRFCAARWVQRNAVWKGFVIRNFMLQARIWVQLWSSPATQELSWSGEISFEIVVKYESVAWVVYWVHSSWIQSIPYIVARCLQWVWWTSVDIEGTRALILRTVHVLMLCLLLVNATTLARHYDLRQITQNHRNNRGNLLLMVLLLQLRGRRCVIQSRYLILSIVCFWRVWVLLVSRVHATYLHMDQWVKLPVLVMLMISVSRA